MSPQNNSSTLQTFSNDEITTDESYSITEIDVKNEGALSDGDIVAFIDDVDNLGADDPLQDEEKSLPIGIILDMQFFFGFITFIFRR